ncbi:MAG: tagaturonate epimerase family protein [Candidatus Bipolaricaulota bacterium]|nr:tagaturonate epimerase family protein [Candidatus Bipolaricaulota bacterium]MDW8126926.1 tagaturonate epimerase family protein [Candidatus Bipolaricaulota bacterium]
MWDSAEAANIRAILGEELQVLCGSARTPPGVKLCLVQRNTEKSLFVMPPQPGFEGFPVRGGLLCPLTWRNAYALISLLPELQPKRIPREKPSFGFGDRLGLATPGHLLALQGASVFPVLAQQSMRENARTGRSFADVLADAIFGVFQAGWEKGFGADADHLKSVDEAQKAARLGYTIFTYDPSDFLVPVGNLSKAEFAQKSQDLPLSKVKEEYVGRDFFVPGLGKLVFTKEELLLIALKYWHALEFTEEMYRALQRELPRGFDFGLSVDETFEPTSEKEHLFLALELQRRGIQLTSLAPRFPGAMEKALDYRGDLVEFRQALRAHVAIARAFGSYRISLHSGSDKWSLYPVLAQETEGLWHMKTAGTSYLVALEVLVRFSPALFREILILASERFPFDRQSRVDVTDEFVRYAHPLLGEDLVSVPIVGGRLRFARLRPIFAEKKLPPYVPVAQRERR